MMLYLKKIYTFSKKNSNVYQFQSTNYYYAAIFLIRFNLVEFPLIPLKSNIECRWIVMKYIKFR